MLMGYESQPSDTLLYLASRILYVDLDTHRLVSGAIVLLAGGPISRRSTLQSSVSRSSTESEYAASRGGDLASTMRELKQDFPGCR